MGRLLGVFDLVLDMYLVTAHTLLNFQLDSPILADVSYTRTAHRSLYLDVWKCREAC